MFAIILLIGVMYWIGYKTGRSYFYDVPLLLYAICTVAIMTGAAYYFGGSPESIVGIVFAGAWNAGIGVGVLHERRAKRP